MAPGRSAAEPGNPKGDLRLLVFRKQREDLAGMGRIEMGQDKSDGLRMFFLEKLRQRFWRPSRAAHRCRRIRRFLR